MKTPRVDLATRAAVFIRSTAYRELSLRQLALIAVIADEAGPHTVRGLANRLQLSKPVVTRALNSLYQLVERRPDHKDRRSVFLTLTEAGRRFRDDLLTQARADG